MSFHHFHTRSKHIVQSSLAQVFSSEAEGFALKDGSVPPSPNQRLNVQLPDQQAYELGLRVLSEYASRTEGRPLRVVVHKPRQFDDPE